MTNIKKYKNMVYVNNHFKNITLSFIKLKILEYLKNKFFLYG